MSQLFIDTQNECRLLACPSPFSIKRFDHAVVCGGTILDILEATETPVYDIDYTYIFVGDVRIPYEWWGKVRPKPGQDIILRALPGDGGGDKNPLRTILSIAVLAVAPQLAGLAGLGAFGTAGIGVVGTLLVNAIAPPPKPGRLTSPTLTQESPTYFIEAARNQAKPFDVVPQILGEHRVTPPYAAQPFTEVVGDDQFVRMLFAVSKGPALISNLKIGETAIENFDEVDFEIRNGFDDDDPLSLITQTVTQLDLNVELTQAGGFETRTTEIDTDEIEVDITLPRGLIGFNNNGSESGRTVELDVEISITGQNNWSASSTPVNVAEQTILAATIPSGFPAITLQFRTLPAIAATGFIYIDRFTGVASITKPRLIQTSVPGAFPGDPRRVIPTQVPTNGIQIGTWSRASGGTVVVTDTRNSSLFDNVVDIDTGDFAPTEVTEDIVIAQGDLLKPTVITASTSQVIRKSVRFPVARNQYDVRIRRTTADNSSNQIFDDTFWTALRSIKDAPPVFDTNIALVAMRIKATGQLNGVVDTFNCLASYVGEIWDGSSWVTDIGTNNPASICKGILQGNSNSKALPNSRLDLTSFQNWFNYCGQKGYEFNQYIDFSSSVLDIFNTAASAGHGSLTSIDGKYGVIFDDVKTTPIQHFTPRNSSNFSSTKVFTELPHAFRVRFANEDINYQQDERIVYNDGFNASNATLFETLELPGVTKPDLVYKHARYHLAVAKLRPETYSLEADIEHLVSTRGDLVRVTHDITQWGLGSARIIAVNSSGGFLTTIEIDDEFDLAAGDNYSVNIRGDDNTQFIEQINTTGTLNSVLIFTDTAIADTTNISVGDLVSYGVMDSQTQDLLINSVVPQEDLRAKLTFVDYSPAIFNADIESIPTFNSNISAIENLDVPIIDTILSDESVAVRSSDGSLRPVIYIKLNLAVNRPLHRISSLEVEFKPSLSDTQFNRVGIFAADATDITIIDVGQSISYDIRLRYRFKDGQFGPYTEITHVVSGKTNAPPAPDTFMVQSQGDGTRDYSVTLNNPPPDIKGFRIFQASGTCASNTFPDDYTEHLVIPVLNNIGGTTIGKIENNLLAAGTYCFAALTEDTGGNQSSHITQEIVLGDPRFGLAIYSEDLVNSQWPGTKTSCSRDPVTGYLVPDDTTTWSDLGPNWNSGAGKWADDPVSPITYVHPSSSASIDIGSSQLVTPNDVTTVNAGTLLVEYQDSTDNISFSGWKTTGTPTTARYFRYRITVTNPDADGVLASIITINS